jgi:acyl dehydratase
MLTNGQKYIHPFSFSQSEVIAFAKVTGDNNPVHLDDEFASQTVFKKKIIHGMLGASVLSKVFGTIFPGNGTIYLNQTLNFYKPMYVDEYYEAIFEVKDLIFEKQRAIITTTIVDIDNKIVLAGEACIMHAKILQQVHA